MAKRKTRKTIRTTETKGSAHRSNWWAWGLIAVGTIFFLGNYSLFEFTRLWPAVLVVIGILMLRGQKS